LLTHLEEDANRTKGKERVRENLDAKGLVVRMEVMGATVAFNLATKMLWIAANKLMFHIHWRTTSVKRLNWKDLEELVGILVKIPVVKVGEWFGLQQLEPLFWMNLNFSPMVQKEDSILQHKKDPEEEPEVQSN
jgi:hypothetical protein